MIIGKSDSSCDAECTAGAVFRIFNELPKIERTSLALGHGTEMGHTPKVFWSSQKSSAAPANCHTSRPTYAEQIPRSLLG